MTSTQTGRGGRVKNLIGKNVLAINGSNRFSQQLGKITIHHGLCRDRIKTAISEVLNGTASGTDPCSLVVAKHEQLVFDNRETNRCAELILLGWISWYPIQIVFPTVRIQHRILENFKQSAMHLIRAGLNADLHDAARRASILGTGAVGNDLHVPNRFHRWADHKRGLIDEINHVHVVINAVQQEVVFAC